MKFHLNNALSFIDYVVKDPDLRTRVKFSVKAHLFILLAITIVPLFIPRHRKYLKRQPVYSVNIVSVPVSVPEKQQSAPAPVIKQQPAPATAPKPETKTQPAPQQTKKTEPKKQTTSKPAAPAPKPLATPSLAERLSSRLKEADRQQFVPPAASATRQSVQTAQKNIGVSSPSDFPFQYYLTLIQDKINSCWAEPNMALDKKYSAVITFVIFQDGSVRDIRVRNSSAITNFDQSGIRAVELAKPFPKLPPGYSGSSLTVNVAFNME